MADTIKEQLEAANEKIKAYEEAGLKDLSWYTKEIDRLNKENSLLKGDLQSRKEKEYVLKRERATIKKDQEAELAHTLGMYNQSAHTRFRLLDRPARGLDIFGNPDTPVFDLGVTLDYFSGPVYVPAQVVIEMAQSIYMLTVEDSEKLRQELAFSKAKNEKAAVLGTELTDGISDLVNRFYTDLDSLVVDSSDDDEGESESDGKSNGADGKSDENSGQADGDNSVEKSDGVSDDSGNADGESGTVRKLLDEL